MSELLMLRPATTHDGEVVYRLICELEQCEFNQARFLCGYEAKLKDAHYFCQLAWHGGQPVGMISLHLQFHLHHANWVAEIQELVVLPGTRNLGIGKALLAWAEDTARNQGAEQTELSTSVRRINAHRFYQREGYTQSHFRFTKSLM